MQTNKVTRYIPRSQGIVYAVLWTGNAECLVGFPDLNKVVQAVQSITDRGVLQILAVARGVVDTREIYPHKAYIVLNFLGQIEVWDDSLFRHHYEVFVEKPLLLDKPESIQRDGGKTKVVLEE